MEWGVERGLRDLRCLEGSGVASWFGYRVTEAVILFTGLSDCQSCRRGGRMQQTWTPANAKRSQMGRKQFHPVRPDACKSEIRW